MRINLFSNFKMRLGKRFAKNSFKRPMPVEWQGEEEAGQPSKKFKPNSWTECNKTTCSKGKQTLAYIQQWESTIKSK